MDYKGFYAKDQDRVLVWPALFILTIEKVTSLGRT
jgi:hypothetical protein